MRLKNPKNYEKLFDYNFKTIVREENITEEHLQNEDRIVTIGDDTDLLYHYEGYLVHNMGHSRRGQYYNLIYSPEYNTFTLYATEPDGTGGSIVLSDIFVRLVADGLVEKKSDAVGRLTNVEDWVDIQNEAYDECMLDLINDDTPITAFIEWLQKKYPNGVKFVKNKK